MTKENFFFKSIIFVRDWKVKLTYVGAGKEIRADHSLMDSIELNNIFEKMTS